MLDRTDLCVYVVVYRNFKGISWSAVYIIFHSLYYANKGKRYYGTLFHSVYYTNKGKRYYGTLFYSVYYTNKGKRYY
ncbi:unnamed protein product, partial [Timema podura]|nr:unnamed protein product [Timema podura]